jgi:hypothetical protein
MTQSTVSDESDLTPETGSEQINEHSPPEAIVIALMNGLDPKALSLNQRGMLHAVHGALGTSRNRLLNTTAVVINQRKDAAETRASLLQFRDETATKLSEFSKLLDNDHLAMEQCIASNVKLLTEMGESEAAIARLLSTMGATPTRTPLPRPVLPELREPAVATINTRLMRDLDQALPPCQSSETTEDFNRCAVSSSDSKRRAAAAFPIPTPPLRSAMAPAPPVKLARFETGDSISTAQRFHASAAEGIGGIGFGPSISGMDSAAGTGKPTLDAIEEFNTEAENMISSLIYRQVGEELLNVPARIRSPKLESPSKYAGTNNHRMFLNWVEEITTWMRASFMGGPGPADEYRITVMKAYLSGTALQWFIDYVEPRNGHSLIPYDFTSIVCAMHR